MSRRWRGPSSKFINLRLDTAHDHHHSSRRQINLGSPVDMMASLLPAGLPSHTEALTRISAHSIFFLCQLGAHGCTRHTQQERRSQT